MRSCGVEAQALRVATESFGRMPRLQGKLTVQKSYNRSAIVGILGNVAYCGINNIRAFSTLSGFDPDQVHQISQQVRDTLLSCLVSFGVKTRWISPNSEEVRALIERLVFRRRPDFSCHCQSSCRKHRDRIQHSFWQVLARCPETRHSGHRAKNEQLSALQQILPEEL